MPFVIADALEHPMLYLWVRWSEIEPARGFERMAYRMLRWRTKRSAMEPVVEAVARDLERCCAAPARGGFFVLPAAHVVLWDDVDG